MYHLSFNNQKDSLDLEKEVLLSKTEEAHEFVPEGEKIGYIPDQERTVRTVDIFYTGQVDGSIEYWDSKVVDGDIVSIYVNGVKQVDAWELGREKQKLDLKFKEGKNDILLYAHNLGSIPPNTLDVRLVIDGTPHVFKLRSDMNHCERVVVVKE